MMIMKKNLLIWGTVFVLAATGCYEEEHFSYPGPYDTGGLVDVDTLPNPFGRERVNGHWLIRNNVVDYEQVGFRAYSDFHPEVASSVLSWYDNGEGFAFRQHYNVNSISDADHFNGDALSYESNGLYSRGFLECGPGKSWYVYARVSINYSGHDLRFYYDPYVGTDGFENRCVLCGNYYGGTTLPAYTFAVGGGAQIGVLDETYANGLNYWGAGTNLEIECVYMNGMLMFGFNNTWMFTYSPTSEEVSFPYIFHPWRNSMSFHDLYIEGDYVPVTDMVAYRNEAGYATIQHPALTERNGEVLLFAEGRKYNIELTDDVDAVRSNATDIVLKRSSNGGAVFGEIEVVAGGGESVCMSPCVVTDGDGTVHLFYTFSPEGVSLGNDNRICYRSSTDGSSWSEEREIDATLTGYENYEIETVNGHAVCLEDGTLVVPIHYTLGRNELIAMLVSSDGGENWMLSEVVNGLRNSSCDLWEENGEVYCLLASSEASSRTLSVSDDGGMTWSVPEALAMETGTVGYMLDGATAVVANGTWVHFSPTNQEGATVHRPTVQSANWLDEIRDMSFMYISEAPNLNTGMIVTTSSDRGTTWSDPADVFTRRVCSDYVYRVGNMDAVALDDGSVVCVYEGGMEVPYEGLKVYKMTEQ